MLKRQVFSYLLSGAGLLQPNKKSKSTSVLNVLLIVCCCLTVGCGESAPSEQVIRAKQLLQTGQQQDALDVLKDDRTAESHYLKTLALERLGSHDVAKKEIKEAIAKDPKNVKYRGLQLRVDLFKGEIDSANKLVDLYQKSPPSAALALFAAYAYKGKSLRQSSAQKMKEASELHAKAMSALKTAADLCAEIPELQSEILVFAIKFQLGESARKVIKRIEQDVPDGVDLLKEKIDVALLTNNLDEAVKLARLDYQKKKQNEQSAMKYANVLAKAPSTAENDEAFAAIHSKYPKNVVIVTRYALFLTRANRLQQAVELLAKSLKKLTDGDERAKLIYIAIDLPLETGDVQLTEQQLKQYQSQIADPLIIAYFEGRIAYLKKDYETAAKKMLSIVEAQKKDVQTSRALAGEALQWARIIIADKIVADQLQKTADTVRQQLDLKKQNDQPGDQTKKSTKVEPEKSKSVDSPKVSKETKKPVDTKPANQ